MANVLQNLDWSVLYGVIPALVCITIHELAHGLTAYWLGDSTAKDMGRLTLNPIKHIDPFGLLAMVIFRFGWAKPVPVNILNFKNPKRYMAITALAGPVSNVILAVVVMFIYGLLLRPLGGNDNLAIEMIRRTAYLSIALAVFNMIPIPPLDGSKVLFSLISDEYYFMLMRYERYGMILLILFITTDFFSRTIGQTVSALVLKFSVIANVAFDLVN